MEAILEVDYLTIEARERKSDINSVWARVLIALLIKMAGRLLEPSGEETNLTNLLSVLVLPRTDSSKCNLMSLPLEPEFPVEHNVQFKIHPKNVQ